MGFKFPYVINPTDKFVPYPYDALAHDRVHIVLYTALPIGRRWPPDLYRADLFVTCQARYYASATGWGLSATTWTFKSGELTDKEYIFRPCRRLLVQVSGP